MFCTIAKRRRRRRELGGDSPRSQEQTQRKEGKAVKASQLTFMGDVSEELLRTASQERKREREHGRAAEKTKVGCSVAGEGSRKRRGCRDYPIDIIITVLR